MNQQFHKLLIITTCLTWLSLTGCQTLVQPPEPPSVATIKIWVNEGKYSQAIKAIEQQPESKALNHLLSEINQKISEETVTTLASVENEVANEKWHNARELIAATQEDMPPQQALNVSLEQISEQEQYKQYLYASDEAVKRAAWITARIQLQRHKINKEGEGLLNTYRLQQLRDDEQSLVQQLIQYAYTALAHQEIDKARACYTAAAGLSNDTNSNQTLLTLQKEIQKQQIAPLIVQLDEAIAQKNVLTQRKIINALKDLQLDNEQTSKINELNQKLHKHAEQLVLQGDTFYSKGQLLEANAVWELAVQIDVNNPNVEDKIARVKKVLRNLENLRSHSETDE